MTPSLPSLRTRTGQPCAAPKSGRTLWAALLALCWLPLLSYGQQWTAQSSGLPTSPPLGVRSLSAVSSTVAWAVAYDASSTGAAPNQSFTRTTNGGTTWTAGTIPGLTNYSTSSISAVDANNAWVTLFDDVTDSGGVLYRTSNGGTTWTRQLSTGFVASQGGFPNAVHMYDSNNGWCMGDPTSGYFEMYRTSNGGTTWTRVASASIPATQNGEVAFIDAVAYYGNSIWFGTNFGRVYRSTDQGATWSVSSTGLTSFSRLAFSDALNGLGHYNGVWRRTTDGGTTWTSFTPTGTPLLGALAGVTGLAGAFVSTSNAGSAYTTNNGASWTTLDTDGHTGLGFFNPQVGWSGGFSSLTPSMFRWVGPSTSGYCIPSNPSCGASGNTTISNVTISNTALNSTSGCNDSDGPGYTVFAPTTAGATATLAPGGFYALSVTATASSIISVWLDANQNRIFESTEWVQVTTGSTAGQPATISFQVPATALLGNTGLRVRARLIGNANGSGDACSTFGSGEAEDYTVTISSCNLATPAPTSNSPLCVGSTLTLSAPAVSGATSYRWTGPNGFTASTLSTSLSNVTTAAAGTYTLTASNSVCSTSASVTVAVSALPTAGITASGPTTFCQGGSVTLTATGGTSYVWSTGATTTSIVVTTAGSYSVTATSAGCSATSAATTVTVNPNTTATFSYAGAPFCQSGPNLTPTITGTAGGTFSSASGLNLNAQTGAITAASSTPGTYTVTYSVGGACPSTGTATVIINRAPVASFSYPTTANCAGTTGTVAATLGNGSATGTFSAASGLSLNAQTGAINLAASTAGTYTVTNTIAAANGCAAVSATADVTINPAASAAFGYPTGPFCQSGVNPTPTVTGTPGGTFASTSGLSLNAQTGAITAASSTPGTYTVTYTAGTTCPASASTQVTITAPATAGFGYANASYCTSQSSSVTVALANGATAGSFSSPSGLSLDAATGAITPSTSTPGTYTVTNTLAPAGGCAAVTSTTTVSIAAPATAGFSYAATSYCTSQSAAVTPTLVSGATAGTFSSTSGLSLDAQTGAITPGSSTPGTYVVINTVAGSGGCATITSTATVSIAAPGSAAFSYPTTGTYCAGSNGSVTLALGSGATAGTFSSSAGLALDAATGVINLAGSTAGTYTITNTLAASGGCAAVTATATVTVTPAASAAFAYSAGTFCQSGSNPTPTVTGTSGGTFSSTAGLSLNAQTGAINLTASTPGTYTVTYTTGTACPALGTATVTVTTAPVATFGYATGQYCAGSTGTLAPTFGTGASAGTFSSTTGLSLNPTTGIINLAASVAGTYTVTSTIAAAGSCAAATATATVTLAPAPAQPTVTIRYTTPGTAVLTASAAPTGGTYQWYLGTTAITGATSQTYTANGTAQPGAYTVVVTGANGCSSQASGSLTVTPTTHAAAARQLQLYPNPTHDGLLKLELQGYQQAAELVVLNTVGQVVHRASIPAGQRLTTLDLHALPVGLYILRTTSESRTDTRSFTRE